MVFANTCEHASSAFIFASTSSDQICLASSDHLKDTDGEQLALRKFSKWNLDLSLLKKKRFAPSNLADNVQTISAVGDDVKLRQVALRELQCGILGGHSRRSKAF